MLTEPPGVVVPNYQQTDDILGGSHRHHRRSCKEVGNRRPESLKPILVPTESPLFPVVIQAFGQAEPSAPGQAAALRVAERLAAKRLLTAPAHFGQVEDSLLEEQQRGSLPEPGYRAGWMILSTPTNERLMVLPYIQSMRPPPRRPGPTPLLPISLPRRHPRHVPEPLLPSEQAPEMPAPQ
jgi:hypothetical protein